MKPENFTHWMAAVAALAALAGCDDPCYSPLVVDSPQVSISDVVATHNKVTLKITPKNAVSVSYALLDDEDVVPTPEDFTTLETITATTVSISHLERNHTYRVWAYSSSGVYDGETSATVSYAFTTQDPVDLSASGTANCYVVPAIGCYMFDCSVKGGGNEPVGAVARVEVLWSDSSDLLSDFVFDDDNPDKAVFVTKAATGNAVVVARDTEDNILWSWHIWCCNGIPATEIYTNADGVPHEMMDRNLGASSATATTCMLYQWGRKDPFPNFNGIYTPSNSITSKPMEELFEPVVFDETGDIEAHNLNFVVTNPATFIKSKTNADITDAWFGTFDDQTVALWGDADGANNEYQTQPGWSGEKSLYDPCPVGYRVPNMYAYSGFSLAKAIGSWDGGWFFQRSDDDTLGAWHPVTGWRLTHTGAVNATSPESGRIVQWYSCPNSSADRMLRLFSHATTCNTAQQVFTSMAAAVRCEKIK